MAKIPKGINGVFKGKIGNLIGSSREGVAVIYTSNLPEIIYRSKAQKISISLFGVLSIIGSNLFSLIIEKQFRGVFPKLSPLQCFLKFNKFKSWSSVFELCMYVKFSPVSTFLNPNISWFGVFPYKIRYLFFPNNSLEFYFSRGYLCSVYYFNSVNGTGIYLNVGFDYDFEKVFLNDFEVNVEDKFFIYVWFYDYNSGFVSNNVVLPYTSFL
jgi:hypothetical protein